MAGRLQTTSSTIMEDREALKREAARERQIRGAMSAVLVGNGTQNRPSRTSALQANAGLNPGLFGAPVRVEQEDATSLMVKNVLGDYQALSKIIQGSATPMAHGPSSHFASAQPTQHPPPAPQPNRRPQQAGAPSVESRPVQRQPNGVSSPLRGLHPQQNPKQAAISQAPNHSKPPVMTAAARKSHMAEPVASTKPSSQDLLTKKGSAPPLGNVGPKPVSNNNNNNSNNNNVGSNRLPSAPDINRIEEVLKEMKVPPLLPNFDEVERREPKRRDDREDRQRNNATSLTTSGSKLASPQVADVSTNDMPTFSSSLNIASIPALPIEPPPVALSPMSSPQRMADVSTSVPPTSSSAIAASTNAIALQNQRLHGQTPTMPPQQAAASMSAPGAPSAAGNASKKPFDLPQVPAMCLSSSSSESEDDDDHESASQEDSQDSDVEQKSMRMNAQFDKSFAATEKFPDKSSQFGDGGVPSLFPQQRVPQLQVQPPNSTEGQSIESPLSASDDTNAEESKASWGLAAFMPGATPNSVTSSVKSPMKSSPRRSPTPSCDVTPSKTARDNRNEHRNRKRGQSGSDHSKESSIEPTSSVEKRKPAHASRQTRSSVTPDSDGPSVPKNPAVRKLNNSRVSPLAQQNHHEGSNGVAGDEPRRGRKNAADDDSSLVVRIPLNVLKRKPLQGSKCDNSSNQVAVNQFGSHNDTKQRLDRVDSTAPAKLNSEESRDSKEVVPSKNITAEERRADSPMSIESISSSSSSRRRHHSPEAVQEKNKRAKGDLQSLRKRVSEKRVDATTRRDKDASSSRKDEKRKTTREERKPLAGPSSSASTGAGGGGVAETPSRTKDERREVKQEPKEDVREREPFVLYKQHIANSRFEWGMTLSDAAERATREQKRTKYDSFIEDAKALKHDGDSETTNIAKAKKYLQSAACFLLGGNLMELARPESSTAYKMYQDTLLLVKHAFSQGLQKAPPGGSQECRLAVLCLKVQAFLCYRVYCAFNRDKDFKDRLLSSHQEFMRIPLANSSKQANNEQLTPNGTTVSPAGSQSSASSGVPNNRDNGLRQDLAANTQPKQVTLSVDLVANLHKYHYRHSFLTRAVELWAQAETLTVDSKNTAFFQAVESGSVNSWMMMPSDSFAFYVREAIFRIDRFAGVY